MPRQSNSPKKENIFQRMATAVKAKRDAKEAAAAKAQLEAEEAVLRDYIPTAQYTLDGELNYEIYRMNEA